MIHLKKLYEMEKSQEKAEKKPTVLEKPYRD